MTLDLIALVLLLVFIGMGAWRGTLASGAGLITLVIAYTAAVFGAQHLSGAVVERFGLASIFATVIAGSGAFAVAFILCAILTYGLKVWDKARRIDEPRSAIDRAGGAIFGGIRGGLIVLLLSVLLNWLDAARDMGVIQGLDATPQTETSRASEATAQIVESVASLAFSGDDGESSPAANMLVRIAARPGVALKSVQALLDDERVHAVQKDRLFWTLVENGAGERAINQASFYSIVHDPALRDQMAQLGLVSEAEAADPQAFRGAMAAMLSELGPRIKGLRNDPELQRLARDPEIISMLENGDTMALVTHPDIQRIVSRVSAQH
jgi:uncharacterized membrane protein required for colicin V production